VSNSVAQLGVDHVGVAVDVGNEELVGFPDLQLLGDLFHGERGVRYEVPVVVLRVVERGVQRVDELLGVHRLSGSLMKFVGGPMCMPS
jgi:hypothetical protein